VNEFLTILADDLDAGINSFESILGQAMYFGLSFSRVGYDFRPLLAPIFSNAIEKQFISKLDCDTAIKVVSESLISLDFSCLPSSPQPLPNNQEAATPPLALLEYPPLAHVTNAILSALNEIRLVCPLSLASSVTSNVQQLLKSLSTTLLDYQSTSGTSWSDLDQRGFVEMCIAVQNILLPYIQTALNAVFQPSQLQSITGLSTITLAEQGVGSLDKHEVLLPLKSFIPIPEPIDLCEKKDETLFVKDRMEEISVALEDSDIKDDVTANENSVIQTKVNEVKDTVCDNIDDGV